jgi:hypothetical protein
MAAVPNSVFSLIYQPVTIAWKDVTEETQQTRSGDCAPANLTIAMRMRATLSFSDRIESSNHQSRNLSCADEGEPGGPGGR